MGRDRFGPGAPLLAIDTTGAWCAVALVAGAAVLAERHEPMARGQAERLLPLIEEALAEAGLGWQGLGGLAVGIGPGNFTGIRIGVAAARGAGLARALPIWGVDAFAALAEGRADGPAPLVALIEAPRLQVIAGRLEGTPRRLAPGAGTIRPDALPAWIARTEGPAPAGAVGQGAAAEDAARAAGLTLAAPVLPPALGVARVAQARAAAGVAPGRPAPLYLRAPDAAPPSDPPPRLLAAAPRGP